MLASGRPTYGIMPVAKQLELEEYGGYILSFNGGRIINAQTGEVIYQKTLPADMPALLYDMSREYKTNIMTYLEETVITPQKGRPICGTGIPHQQDGSAGSRGF